MFENTPIPDIPAYEKWDINEVYPNQSLMGFGPVRDMHFRLITCGGSLVHEYIVKQIMSSMYRSRSTCNMGASDMADLFHYNKFTVRKAIQDLRNANVIRNMQKGKGRYSRWVLTPAAFHAYHTLQLPRLVKHMEMGDFEIPDELCAECERAKYGWEELFSPLVPQMKDLTNQVIRENITSNSDNVLWDFIIAQELPR